MGLLKFTFIIIYFLIYNVSFYAVDIIKQVPVEKRIIALTIDDGPNPYITPKILDLLKKEDVKATFFLIAKKAKQYPELTKRIRDNGHDIGNHSYNHENFQDISLFDVAQNIEKSQSVFLNILGQKPVYFRAPYGRLKIYQKPLLDRYFTNIVGWSVDSRDWEEPHYTQHTIDNVMSRIFSGSIILCHQRDEKRLETLKVLIQKIKISGYNFITLSHLLSVGDRVAINNDKTSF